MRPFGLSLLLDIVYDVNEIGFHSVQIHSDEFGLAFVLDVCDSGAQRAKGFMSDLNFGQLNDLLGHLLRHAVNRGQGAFHEVFEDDAVTPLQFMIVELISQNQGITHSDICKAMQTSASVVTTTLKPLQEDGRLLKVVVNGDGRKTSYALSKEGEAWFERIKPKIALSEARLAEALTEQERADLVRMLKLLASPDK